MRESNLGPTDARPIRQSPESLRRMLMWTHVVLAVIAFFVYLTAIDFETVRGGAGMLLIRGSPVVLPFLVSASWCWQLYTWQFQGPGPLRTVTFAAVLVAGSAIVDAAIVGAFGVLEGFHLALVLINQGFAFAWAANWILDII